MSSILSKGTPSTTKRGFTPPSKVEVPRIRISEPSPGAPEPEVISIPAICPCSTSVIEIAFLSSMDFEVMEAIEPVISLFFIAPYPTTITSFSSLTDSFRMTFKTLLPFTAISCLAKPVYEYIRVLFWFGIEITYLPSRLLTTPVEVPFMRTLTPGRGLFWVSVTTPIIFNSLSWEKENEVLIMHKRINENLSRFSNRYSFNPIILLLNSKNKSESSFFI